jgi:hypothetical protein
MKQHSRHQRLQENTGTRREGSLERAILSSSSQVVFDAHRELLAPSEPEFISFESFIEDDHLVYSVPNAQPVLLKLDAELNTRSFLFEGCVSKAPEMILVDSGASASFASLQWCKRNHIFPKPVYSSGRLAD